MRACRGGAGLSDAVGWEVGHGGDCGTGNQAQDSSLSSGGLAAVSGLRLQSRFEVSVDPHGQCLETGAWAMEGMSSCGRESVAKDRAASTRGKVRSVWPGGHQLGRGSA